MFLALERGVGIAPDHLAFGMGAQAATVTTTLCHVPLGLELTCSGQLAFASQIFALLSTGCSSYSNIRILEGLAPGTREQRVCWYASCFCVCSCIFASLIVSVGCNPAQFCVSGPDTSCSHPVGATSFPHSSRFHRLTLCTGCSLESRLYSSRPQFRRSRNSSILPIPTLTRRAVAQSPGVFNIRLPSDVSISIIPTFASMCENTG